MPERRTIVAMRTWVVPWLLPIGMIGAIALLAAIDSPVGDALGVAWTLGIFRAAVVIMRRSPEGKARLQELETNYWRVGRRR
jgi:hypothetical protein